MKLMIRSVRVPRSKKHERLLFYGRNIQLNIHETGLTIEGLMPNVWYPIFMRFLYAALSDWTIRTIPFSTILQCKVVSNSKVAYLLTLMLLLVELITFRLMQVEWVTVLIVVITSNLVFFAMVRFLLYDYVQLDFRTQGNQRSVFRMRFPRAHQQLQLFEELRRHRLEVAAPTLAKVATEVTEKDSRIGRIRRWWRRIR